MCGLTLLCVGLGEARYQVDEEALVLSEHALTPQDFYDPLSDNQATPAPQPDEPTLVRTASHRE